MKTYLCVSMIFCIAMACYHNSLKCGFVFDDMSAIRDNKDLRPVTPLINLFQNDFWGTSMKQERSHKSYRPLCVLTFRLNYFFGGIDPFGYHLVNILMHAIVSIQIFYFGLSLGMSMVASFLAAILFVVHPVHVEAVTGVVGRAELLSSIFFLLSLNLYGKSGNGKESNSSSIHSWFKLFGTVLLVAMATLSKEQGITAVAVCCIYELTIIRKQTLKDIVSISKSIILFKFNNLPPWFTITLFRICFLIGSTLLLLYARIKVMGAQLPVFTKFDNPGAAAGQPQRFLTHNYMLPLNAWLLLCPSWLCCDWTMGTIPLIESFFDCRNLATVAFYVGFFLILVFLYNSDNIPKNSSISSKPTTVLPKLLSKKSKIISTKIPPESPLPTSCRHLLFLSLIIFPFIPASNLFFPVGFVVAERILYMPSIGFCFLIASSFTKLLCYFEDKSPNIFKLLQLSFVLVIILFSLKTYIRNEDWKDEYSLFMSGVKINKANAKLFNNVGHALENEKKFEEALKFFLKASKVQPDDIGAHVNVGRTYAVLEKYVEAEASYRQALALLPPVKPGQSYTARVAPSHLNVFINLGNLLAKNQSRLNEVDNLLKTAISMRSDFVQAYINRGDVLLRMGRMEEGRLQYIEALKYEPNNPDLHYNLGVVAVESKRTSEAIELFDKALSLDPDHKHSLLNSAILLQNIDDHAVRLKAETRLLRLTEIDPNDEKVYFNLGLLYTDIKKYEKARKSFEKSIELNPSFRSALFNLALLLANDMKLQLEAVPVLEQLLKYHPHHVNGLILLGDISISHLKDLNRAQMCFEKILKLNPNNIQASHNLCVVFSEQGDLLKAEKCLSRLVEMAPKEEYIKKHLLIVRQKIANLMSKNGTKGQISNIGNSQDNNKANNNNKR